MPSCTYLRCQLCFHIRHLCFSQLCPLLYAPNLLAKQSHVQVLAHSYPTTTLMSDHIQHEAPQLDRPTWLSPPLIGHILPDHGAAEDGQFRCAPSTRHLNHLLVIPITIHSKQLCQLASASYSSDFTLSRQCLWSTSSFISHSKRETMSMPYIKVSIWCFVFKQGLPTNIMLLCFAFMLMSIFIELWLLKTFTTHMPSMGGCQYT